MYKTLRNFSIGFVLFLPVIVLGAQVPDRLGQLFPVYSAPTNITYQTYSSGLEISFQVEKKHACLLPKKKEDQDAFATLGFLNESGAVVTKPANVFPADNKDRALKNILIIGVPTNIGPYAVEVPEEIMASLLTVDINIFCKRPIIGDVYARIGPFAIGDLANKIPHP